MNRAIIHLNMFIIPLAMGQNTRWYRSYSRETPFLAKKNLSVERRKSFD